MEEVGPDNEIGLDDVNGGNVVDVLDGGYTINDYVYCRKAIYILFIASALLSVMRRPCDHCDYDVNAKRNFKIAKL